MADKTKEAKKAPPVAPAPVKPKAEPKKVNHKGIFEKSGLCPKCGGELFLTRPDKPAKCEWCFWLVPKGWKLP